MSKENSKNTLPPEKGEAPQGFSIFQVLTMLVFLFVLGYTERTVYFSDPVRGLTLHAYTLVGLILLVSAFWDQQEFRYLLALSIVPLMRIIGLAIPFPHFPAAFWYLMVSLTMLVAVMMYAERLALSPADLGIRLNGWPVQLLVGLSGILIGAGQYFLIGDTLTSEPTRQFSNAAVGAALLLGYSFVEELIFRGMLQHIAERILGDFAGWLYVAAVYAVLTLGSYSLGNMAAAFGASLFFSWVVWRTKSLLGVSLAHGLASITLFLILPGLNL